MEKQVLPADVFDALELSALAYGGIGAGRYVAADEREAAFHGGVPMCAVGHAWHLEGLSSQEVTGALALAGIGFRQNDLAVRAINKRLNRDPNARVTFKQWAKELNVVRGD